MQDVDSMLANFPARAVRTILVMDLVESVRLMESDEEEAVAHWRRLVEHVEHRILPTRQGRKVKSLGDGMLIEFCDARQATAAAFDIQSSCSLSNEGLPPDRHMFLRMGMHVSGVLVHSEDLYGHGVNLAQRLSTLAGPGELVVSADIRDQLTFDLDADIEDLGQCHLKHLSEPVRAYRLGPPGPRPVIGPGVAAFVELLPTIAVIPFDCYVDDADHFPLGEVVADDLIATLSRTPALRVISRLSTTAFRGRSAPLGVVRQHLGANYVLSGAYRVSKHRLALNVELVDTESQAIAWSASLRGSVRAIVNGEDDLAERIAAEIGGAILNAEIRRSQMLALPNLASYTLLMGAIALMHRGATHDFDRAGAMLEALTERTPRQAVPHAWLAKWHVLRYNRGRSVDRALDAKMALDCTKRALDNEPDCALALTIDGFVHTNLLKRLDIGQERYEHALEVNPNESLAWLLKGTLHAFKGEGQLAVEGTERALVLSPLDPLRYFYESLAATAAHSAGLYERAIQLAERSLRTNRVHPSTFRALAIAQSQLGRIDDARKTVKQLLQIQPGLTVRGYLESNPSGQFETGKVWAEALRRAGVPE